MVDFRPAGHDGVIVERCVRTRRDTGEEEQQTRPSCEGGARFGSAHRSDSVCLSNSDQFDSLEWPTIPSEFYRLPTQHQPPMEPPRP
jgi:hypothetical protein